MRELTEAQKERQRQIVREWESVRAPCGIPHDDIYNPCLPEREPDGSLFCCTCGLSQAPASSRAEEGNLANPAA